MQHNETSSNSNIGKCLQVDTTTTVHPSRPQACKNTILQEQLSLFQISSLTLSCKANTYFAMKDSLSLQTFVPENKNGPMCWYTPWRILVCKSKKFWGFDIGQILPNAWQNDILASKWFWPDRYKIRWATQFAASFVSSILQLLCFSTWKNHLLVRFRTNLPIGGRGSILLCGQKLLPHEPSSRPPLLRLVLNAWFLQHGLSIWLVVTRAFLVP